MYGEYEKALAGLKYGLESDIGTGAAKAIIQFGAPVLRKSGDDVGAYAPESVTATFSANFVTSNSIVAKVAGVTLAAVVFATDHATTFAALVAAIAAVPGVTVVASDATTRTITVKVAGQATGLSFTITGGASQATVAMALASGYSFGGVALRVQKGKVRSTDDSIGARYDLTEPVPMLKRGGIWVHTADSVASFKAAYLTTDGAWTDESAGNIAISGLIFESSTTAAGLAQLAVK